jgi:(hydroxyamino)benzene mutase
MHREMTPSHDRTRQLMWHGVMLFLLGLLTGLIIPLLTIPRLGVSAHLEGVLNGLFLIVLGAIWNHLRFTPNLERATFRIALLGTYANWAFTLLGGMLGTGALTPIAADGRKAEFWKEALVGAGLLTLVVAMIVCCVFVLWGLRSGR